MWRFKPGDERGAAIVEAALVLPVLVLFFGGIVDFGFALNDLQDLNNASFRAARELAVDDYEDPDGCVVDPNTATDTEKLVCMARGFSARPAAETYVKVEPPSTMAAGEQALLCMATPVRSITGLISPITSGMTLHTVRYVRIESDDVDISAYADALPAGSDWSWCT